MWEAIFIYYYAHVKIGTILPKKNYNYNKDSRPKADDDVRVVVATDEEDLLLANNANKNINNTSNNNGGKRPVNAAEEKSSRGDSGNNINVYGTPEMFFFFWK